MIISLKYLCFYDKIQLEKLLFLLKYCNKLIYDVRDQYKL